MARKVKRAELIAALREKRISFGKKTKVDELRRIYDETMGKEATIVDCSEDEQNDDVIVGENSEQRATTTNSGTASNEHANKIPKSANLDAAFKKHAEKEKNIGIPKPIVAKFDDDDESPDIQERLNAMILRTPTAAEVALQKLKEEEEYLDAQLRIQEKKLRLMQIQQQQCSDTL